MRWSIRSLFIATILAGSLIAGCDPAGSRATPSPTEPSELLGGLLGGKKVQGYTLVKAPLLSLQELSISGLIGVQGGQITLLGHTLTVPAGAVGQPTLFVLTVLPTGYVEVDLEASLTSLLGGLLDIGGSGFLKPVPVTLSYAAGTNVSDPRRLTILRVNSLLGYGKYEVMPSRVNLTGKTVTTELDHFSRYVIAMPY
jgi:hypothetical protein